MNRRGSPSRNEPVGARRRLALPVLPVVIDGQGDTLPLVMLIAKAYKEPSFHLGFRYNEIK
jgi:hypothetical protein